MKLTAYQLDGHSVAIRPAPVDRPWMDATNERYAYRCLPLSIANAYGWEILCAESFSAVWDGGQGLDAVKITLESGSIAPAISHFGSGILTFHVACLFQTEPGFDLMLIGPINRPKDGIAALTGIIETDWSPYSFTMNWLFTRAGAQVTFQKGEPFCHILPLRRGELELFQPEIRRLSDNPDLKAEHEQWMASRGQFLQDLKSADSDATAQKWQKLYHRGVRPGGTTGSPDHVTRVKLNGFEA